MARRAATRGIAAAGFTLNSDNRRELADKFPRVDLDGTYELFKDKALALGWIYSDWLAAFRNYIRNGEKYGGIEYRVGLSDPKFDQLIERAKALGFRMPLKIDSVGTYRQALDDFDKKQASQSSLDLSNVLKRIPK